MSKKVGLRNFSVISRLKALVSVVETFNRSNSSSLGKTDSGATWTNIRGSWGISSNTASSSDSASGYPLATLTFSKEDITLTAKGVGPGVGTAFWVTDSDNWWGTYVDTEQTCDTCSSGGNCNAYSTQCTASNPTVAQYGCISANATVYGVTSYYGGNCASYATGYTGGNCASYGTTYYGPTCGIYATNSSSTSCAGNGVTGSNSAYCVVYGAGSCTTYGTKRYYAGAGGYFTNCNAYNYGCSAYVSGSSNYGCTSYSSTPGNQYCAVYFSSGGSSTYCASSYATSSYQYCSSSYATQAAYGVTANSTCNAYGVTSYTGGDCSAYGTVCNSTNSIVYSACNCVNNDKVKIVKNVAGTITTVATLAFASTIAAIKTVLSGNSVTVSAYSDTSATTQIGSSQETTISGQTKSKVHGILKGVVTYSPAATSSIDQFEVN